VGATLSGPVLLYAALAVAETGFLRREAPPVQRARQDAASGRWVSEWASFLPPLVVGLLEMR